MTSPKPNDVGLTPPLTYCDYGSLTVMMADCSASAFDDPGRPRCSSCLNAGRGFKAASLYGVRDLGQGPPGRLRPRPTGLREARCGLVGPARDSRRPLRPALPQIGGALCGGAGCGIRTHEDGATALAV